MVARLPEFSIINHDAIEQSVSACCYGISDHEIGVTGFCGFEYPVVLAHKILGMVRSNLSAIKELHHILLAGGIDEQETPSKYFRVAADLFYP